MLLPTLSDLAFNLRAYSIGVATKCDKQGKQWLSVGMCNELSNKPPEKLEI